MPLLLVPGNTVLEAWYAMMDAISFPDQPERQGFTLGGVTGYLATLAVGVGIGTPSRENPNLYNDLVIKGARLGPNLDGVLAAMNDNRRRAADLLITTLVLHRECPELASQQQAIALIQRREKRKSRDAGNKERKISVADTFMKNSWKSYKSISHFCAALHLYSDQFISDDDEDGEETFTELTSIDFSNLERVSEAELLSEIEAIRENPDLIPPEFRTLGDDFMVIAELLATVLATARQIGRDAAQAFAHGQKSQNKPLLAPDEIWGFPPALTLPDVVVPYPALSKEDRESLGLS